MNCGVKNVKMKKTTMSVSEMRQLLGLKKTESYYILKQNHFKVLTVDGHYRVDLESFEQWYSNQWHYQKISGPPPGYNLLKYMTVKDVSAVLGMKADGADWLVRRSGRFKLYETNGLMCILRKDFEEWYSRQYRYKKVTGEPPGLALPPSYSGHEVADLLGIPLRNALYELTSSGVFQSKIIDGQLRIDKQSFDLWVAKQTKYKIIE